MEQLKTTEIQNYITADDITVLGENRLALPDSEARTYLLFHDEVRDVGIMTKLLSVLGWLRYSEHYGFTLAVLMTEDDFCPEHNFWEFYFEQPMLKESCDIDTFIVIRNAFKCALTPAMTRFHYKFVKKYESVMRIFPPTITFPCPRDYKSNPGLHNEYRHLYRKYIRFKPDVQKHLDSEYRRVLKGKGRILGVRSRGTDYNYVQPYNHPKQPSPDELLALAVNVKLAHHWDYIYLATEEQKVYELFEKEFPGRIITSSANYLDAEYAERSRMLDNPTFLNYTIQNDEAVFSQRELDYLTSMYLLSKCDMLIGGLNAGTQAVLIMKDGEFEYLNLIDHGSYL